jgi:hypothetical protein
MKKIYLFLILITSLSSKTCDFKEFIQSNHFTYKPKYITVYINGKPTKKLDKTQTIFPECYIKNKKLFMFLYRDDLKNILLVQFIFKTDNYYFQNFAEDLIYKNEIINKAIKNIKSNKKIIIEVSSNEHLEIRFEKKNKEIILINNKISKKKKN